MACDPKINTVLRQNTSHVKILSTQVSLVPRVKNSCSYASSHGVVLNLGAGQHFKANKMAIHSNVCSVFCGSNTANVGLNPARGMNICLASAVFMLTREARGRTKRHYPLQGVL
jgi:hypothetical protein